MTSDTIRRNDELRHTEDLLETSQSIIQNFKLQREAALKKQQHVMKTLKSMNFSPVSTENFINSRHSPIQPTRDPYSTPPIETRMRQIPNTYLHGSNNICEEINYHSRPSSRIYNPASFTPFIDTFNPISEGMGYVGFHERHHVPTPAPHIGNILSDADNFRHNPNHVNVYSDPANYYRPKSVISDYTGSQFVPHCEKEKQYMQDQKSNIDSQTLIRLLTGPKSDEEIEILKELARREGFNDDVIAKLSSSSSISSATKSSNRSSSISSSNIKKLQDSDKDNESSSDLSISTPKNVNGRMRFRVGSLSTSLDCDDSSVVSSLPTTERAPSSERIKSVDRSSIKTKESSRKNTDNHEEKPTKDVTKKNESGFKGSNSKEQKPNESIADKEESDFEENSILSPLPKKPKCLDNLSSDDSSTTIRETHDENIGRPISSSSISTPLTTNILTSTKTLLCNGTMAPYTFKSAVSGEINETTDDETSTPKSFHSGSGSHSSVSTGYKIQSVASKDRNPFSVINSSTSTDIGGVWNYLRDFNNATNKECPSVSSGVSKDEDEHAKEEELLNIDNLTGFEAEKMNEVLKLSKREKQISKEIEQRVSGIKLLENILKETTEKALLEQRQLSELKKERREIRKQRKTIFSDLSNQPLSESEMPESVRKSTSRVSPLNLTCESDNRPTPSYPMNRAAAAGKDDDITNSLGVRFDDDLQSDRTDVLLLKPCYQAIPQHEDSSDSGTLSEQSTIKLNFGDTTVRGIIERVIETENQSKSVEETEEPLQSDLQRLMQEYLSEMVAHETLQKELRENIPNYDDIEKSITEQVHQMHIKAKQEMKENLQLENIVDNAGHLSDVLSARDPPVNRHAKQNKSHQEEELPTGRTEEFNTQRDYPSCSDDALFNDLQRQFTFLKDIKPKTIVHKDDTIMASQKESVSPYNPISKTADIKEIQANVQRLMSSSASEVSTPTTHRSEIINPNKSPQPSATQNTTQTKVVDKSLIDCGALLNYSSSDYQVNSGCSSAPTSDLLKRVVSEGFLNLSSDSHKDKSRRSHSRGKRPKSRRSIDPEKTATLKKYLHASSSSDLTDFDSPRLSISKDYHLNTKRPYEAERKPFTLGRPSSAAGRIQDL